MKPAAFSYVRPDSVEELCAELTRHGEDARILAGGQSLGAMLNMRLVTPAVIVDINRVAGLDRTEVRKGYVVTGALVRQADALAAPTVAASVPLLARALPHVGHYQTRSRGTLAGSVAHADPSAEIPLVLVALDGEVELRAARRRRRVRAREFFTSALVTTRAADEAIVALHWPAARPRSRYGFREFALRAGDYAVVASACEARFSKNAVLEHLSLAFNGCSDRPQLVPASAFEGHRLSAVVIQEIAHEAGNRIECKGDLHASANYRRQLVRTFTEELLTGLLAEEEGHA